MISPLKTLYESFGNNIIYNILPTIGIPGIEHTAGIFLARIIAHCITTNEDRVIQWGLSITMLSLSISQHGQTTEAHINSMIRRISQKIPGVENLEKPKPQDIDNGFLKFSVKINTAAGARNVIMNMHNALNDNRYLWARTMLIRTPYTGFTQSAIVTMAIIKHPNFGWDNFLPIVRDLDAEIGAIFNDANLLNNLIRVGYKFENRNRLKDDDIDELPEEEAIKHMTAAISGSGERINELYAEGEAFIESVAEVLLEPFAAYQGGWSGKGQKFRHLTYVAKRLLVDINGMETLARYGGGSATGLLHVEPLDKMFETYQQFAKETAKRLNPYNPTGLPEPLRDFLNHANNHMNADGELGNLFGAVIP